MDDDNDNEPEFIDLAELRSKVTEHGSADSVGESDSEESGSEGERGCDMDEADLEDGEEVWICRYCDRAFDSEVDLTSHEKQHS